MASHVYLYHDGFACSPFALEVALAIDELRLLLYPLSFLEVAPAIDELRLLFGSLLVSWKSLSQ